MPRDVVDHDYHVPRSRLLPNKFVVAANENRDSPENKDGIRTPGKHLTSIPTPIILIPILPQPTRIKAINMLSNIFALSLLLTTALATPTSHQPRDVISASTIIADIKAIDTAVNHLRAGTAAYNGGVLAQTPLLAGFTEIHLVNRKGFADANLRTTDFTASESTAIVNTVINTVGKDIPAAVDETIAKKPLFDASGTDAVLVGLLKVLLNDHDTFSAAVSKHLTADLVAGAAAVAEIHDAIQRGIDAFST